MQTEILKVSGMTCGGCTSTVGSALKTINGVSHVEVSLGTGEATVEFDERLTSPEQLKSAVKNAGYEIDSKKPASAQKGKCCCH